MLFPSTGKVIEEQVHPKKFGNFFLSHLMIAQQSFAVADQ